MPSASSRKRSRATEADQPAESGAPHPHFHPAKRRRKAQHAITSARTPTVGHDPAVKYGVLARYYRRIQTLRVYLLTQLPSASRLRRKKLTSVGLGPDASPIELLVSRLLDSVLVAWVDDKRASKNAPQPHLDDRQQQRINYTERKKADESLVTVSSAAEGAFSPQSEIVDFVVWLLFKRAKENGIRQKTAANRVRWTSDFPAHVLCHGFQRGQGPRPVDAPVPGRDDPTAYASHCTIAGLYAAKPTQHAQVLKEPPWPQLLALLGAAGERIMISLLMDCSIFLPVDAGRGNFIQVTGKPLCDLAPLSADESQSPSQVAGPPTVGQSLANVAIVRSRMFYARPSITATGSVHFGLKHIHVLNRFPYRSRPTKRILQSDLADLNQKNTVHVMMYLFPRQFGLHNIFTSSVDRAKTTQRFQDYTLREDEIGAKLGKSVHAAIPKRLRGLPQRLTEKIRILHSRCSYYELLQHYCPNPELANARDEETKPSETDSPVPAVSISDNLCQHKPTEKEHTTKVAKTALPPASCSALINRATPPSQVSAFCQAVFKNVIPSDFWGDGDVQAYNGQIFLKKVDDFIQMRRYETISLHDLIQGFKIADIAWLAPPGLRGHKLSKTDLQKRHEIFAEFIYYLFDSFLIPLIRTNFYVTESSMHRNKLFYFRHDVWRCISEPALADLKARMFEEVKQSEAARILGSRDLGYSQLRLLPKQASMRPIMNLRRKGCKKGSTQLAPSINTLLAPAYAMLNLEMKQHPERLGASMFSMRDMYARLKQFKLRMDAKGQPTFYFAKVDVKSAFDTIPQDAVVKLVNTLPSHDVYYFDKHVEIHPHDKLERSFKNASSAPKTTLTPMRQWRTMATTGEDRMGFHDSVEDGLAVGRKNTVFVDGTFRKTQDTAALAGLVASHIRMNLVKIGKKFYRQKSGIPQGSVLSSLLCNYFYADLEARELSFLRSGGDDCLLLRLIDDFLLITTDQSKATRFIEVMHAGHPRYGVVVSPGKSLVNYDLSIDGAAVPRVASGAFFPYCGTLIHCSTLDVMKDRATRSQVVFNTLSVEYSRSPGLSFKNKVFSFFKVQSHFIFFDTAHNSLRTTLRNLQSAFAETATKTWAYAHCLPQDKRPSARLIISTIRELAAVAFSILSRKSRALRHADYEFAASQSCLTWLLLHEFASVLRRKQSGYREVLAWLRAEMRQLQKRQRMRLPKEFE